VKNLSASNIHWRANDLNQPLTELATKVVLIACFNGGLAVVLPSMEDNVQLWIPVLFIVLISLSLLLLRFSFLNPQYPGSLLMVSLAVIAIIRCYPAATEFDVQSVRLLVHSLVLLMPLCASKLLAVEANKVAILVTCSIQGVVAVVGGFRGNSLLSGGIPRLQSTLYNPIELCVLLGVGVIGYLAADSSREVKLVRIIVILLCLMTASRGPIVALGITSIWLISVRVGCGYKVIPPVLMCIFPFCVRNSSDAAFKSTLLSTESRVDIWTQAFRTLSGHGFGVGPGHFQYTYHPLKDHPEVFAALSDPKSLPLLFVVEFGFLSIAIGWIMAVSVATCFQGTVAEKRRISQALLLFITIAGLTETIGFVSNKVEMTLLVGTVLSVIGSSVTEGKEVRLDPCE
jgi:hypothetical protein